MMTPQNTPAQPHAQAVQGANSRESESVRKSTGTPSGRRTSSCGCPETMVGEMGGIL